MIALLLLALVVLLSRARDQCARPPHVGTCASSLEGAACTDKTFEGTQCCMLRKSVANETDAGPNPNDRCCQHVTAFPNCFVNLASFPTHLPPPPLNVCESLCHCEATGEVDENLYSVCRKITPELLPLDGATSALATDVVNTDILPTFNNRPDSTAATTTVAPTSALPTEYVVVLLAVLMVVVIVVIIACAVCFVMRSKTDMVLQQANYEMQTARFEPTIGSTNEYDRVPPESTQSYDEVPFFSRDTSDPDRKQTQDDRRRSSGFSAHDAPHNKELNGLSRFDSEYSAPPSEVQVQTNYSDEKHSSHAGSKFGTDSFQDLYVEIDEIRLGKKIGSGAFANVYRGEVNEQECAVKVLCETEETAVSAFRKELKLMSALPPHENVVQVLAYHAGLSRLMLCLEWCSGGDLHNYVEAHQTSTKKLLKWALQTATGIQHLHAHNIVHRDLALRNLLLTYENNVKVSDFGLSRSTIEDGKKTVSNTGPLRWMAVESITAKLYSFQTDIWSFGVVIWELWSKAALPYENRTPAQVAIDVVTTGLRLSKPDQCPSELWVLVEQCWQHDPDARPTIRQVRELLKRTIKAAKKK